MEKYVKLADVRDLLKRLANEPRYQHEDEDFFVGICTVAGELDELQATVISEPALEATWVPAHKGFMDSDYRCSNCGTWADEGNSGHYSILTDFCKHCGAYMNGGNC